jgi:hypothetical protein
MTTISPSGRHTNLIQVLLILFVSLKAHEGFASNPPTKKKQPSASEAPSIKVGHAHIDAAYFRAYGRKMGKIAYRQGLAKDLSPPTRNPVFDRLDHFESIADHSIESAVASFHQGRYGRSAARLPENIEAWRSEPNVDNPGSDLANWPNSAFTLPQGRSYLEFSPFGYYGASKASPQQFDMQYLLRYGATDNIELRIFGNGATYTGGQSNQWNFSPVGFDTKIQIMTEHAGSLWPAMGFEAYLMTDWLGNTTTNGGTQPGFSFNFDQSLPFDIDFEYNIGAFRSMNVVGKNEWSYNLQWAFQKAFFTPSFSLFIHGYVNGATIPKSPMNATNIIANNGAASVNDNIIGGGFIWSLSKRLSIWGQTSTGTTTGDSSLLTYAGFTVAF